MTLPDPPDRAAFEGALQQDFDVGPFAGPDGAPIPFRLTLAEVRPLRSEASFVLLFEGPLTPALEQGLYPFAHPALGPLAIFVVPVGEADGKRQYEAVFNRGQAPSGG